MTVKGIFESSIEAKKAFVSKDENIKAVMDSADLVIRTLKGGGKVLIFGNGGSASDAQHMAAELVVRFESERESLPCIALSTNTSTLTATGNDYSFTKIFSRQVEGLGLKGDAVIAISTSGNSPNVLEGARAAKAKGLPVIALTGASGGKLKAEADIAIVASSDITARIQEIHITVIHIICKMIEDAFVK